MDTKDLIERLRRGPEAVGAEPLRWIRVLTNGSEIVYQSQISEDEAAHISEIGDEFLPVYSAETIARLQSELEECTEARFEYQRAYEQLKANRDSLQEQVKTLQQDADRYRWLRHGDNDEQVIQKGPIDPTYRWLPRNERLDSMIDKALAATEPKDAP